MIKGLETRIIIVGGGPTGLYCAYLIKRFNPNTIVTLIEQVRYPNHCLHPNVMAIESKEIGTWDDSNPLNCYDTMQLEFNKLFNE